MYPQPQIDIFTGRIYLSELPMATAIFSRNGFRVLDLRPGSSPSMQIYWLTALRIRDASATFIHEISDLSQLNSHLDDRQVSQMPNYSSVHPLSDLTPEESGSRTNPTPNDQMSPSESSESGEDS